MNKTKNARQNKTNRKSNQTFQTKIGLFFLLIVFRTATVWAQPSPIALAPVVPVPAVTAPAMPVPQQTSRVPGQKYIEEVWDELESATFATPTFKELGTLHEGYSFEELWELARTANPSIRQKENLITAASGGRIQAGLYPNPTLIYSGDNLNVHGEVGKHGLAVSQEIVTAKKKKLDRAVASYDVAAARREYSMECLKLQNDLQIAHYEMLHAILVCKVEEFAQQISTDILEVATLLQAERKSQSADVLQFRTMLHTSALSCKQAKNNRLATWQRLVSIMGLPDLPYQPVRGSLITHSPPRNWQTTWTQFQQTSPQLALAQLKVVQAKTYLARQEAEQTSNVFATFSLARDIPAKTTVPFVGVSVPLKIYNKNQGNIIKARAEVAAARREVERVTLSLHQQLAKVFCDYDNAREQIRVYETSVIPDSFEALRQIAEFYCNGKITCLELYTQRQVVVTALLHYINALKTQAIATVRIDGMLLEGILE